MNIEEAKDILKEYRDDELFGVAGREALGVVLSELEKKDKVINEMATYIIRNVSREKTEKLTWLKDKEVIWSYDIKEYFTNKVEREGK